MKNFRRINKKLLLSRLLVLVVVAGLWEYLPSISIISKETAINYAFISSPSRIIKYFIDSFSGGHVGDLGAAVWSTLYASLMGFAMGMITGFVAGTLLAEIHFLDRTFRPYIIFINNLPRIVLIPIILLIFGFGLVSKVLSASLIVFFIVFFNAYEGGRQIEPEVIHMCKILGASRMQLLVNVRLFKSLEWVYGALPNAVAFAILGAITAEVLGAEGGLGNLIVLDLSFFKTNELFSVLIIIGFLGVALSVLAEILGKKLLRWAPAYH